MISNIFTGDYLKRLDNIIQWSEKDVFTKESVSQHSYKVTIFCRVLLEEIFGKNKTPEQESFTRRAVDHAMFHDWDEALLLRDISHETKYNHYNGEEIRKVLNNLSHYLSKQQLIDNTLCGSFVHDSLNEENEDVLMFCKLCDWLALSFFVSREHSLGNQTLYHSIAIIDEGIQQSIEKCEEMFLRVFNIEVKLKDILYYG